MYVCMYAYNIYDNDIMSFQRLIKKKNTVLFDISAISFLKNTSL